MGRSKIISFSFILSILACVINLPALAGDEEMNGTLESILQRLDRLEAENSELRKLLAEQDADKETMGSETATNEVKSGLSLVGFNAAYSFNVLDHAEMTNTKQLYQLKSQADGQLANKLTLGGQITALVNYQSATENSKFGWLMRHPTSANQIGKSASEAVVHSANINMTGRLTEDVIAYLELLYNPEQNFAANSSITGLPRNNANVRKAYILWGNLDKTPWYGALGKMDIPFGWNDTVSPFTNSTNWHSFAGLAYGALLGYSAENLHLRAMAIQGGAQFRNANMPVDGTNVPSRLNNFAVDGNYTFPVGAGLLNVGLSYQHGSSYCQNFVDTPQSAHSTPVVVPGVTRNILPQGVQHFNDCTDNVEAMVAYGVLKYDAGQVFLEYASTLDVWPGTANPYIQEYEASKNKTFTVGGRYALGLGLSKHFDLSLEFSRFNAGAPGSDWEKQDQVVLGASYFLTPAVNLFSEAIHVEGWVPLNFLSGGNPSSLVGTSWSSQSSRNNILNFGLQAGF
ncbi:MAG: hypothetical protein P8M72_12265 [Gammaproteobacteria bacterium]|nr:hypothetical protein [Gammaproteobacteria bacterium]